MGACKVVGWSRQAANCVISSLPFDGRGTHSITPAPHNFACSHLGTAISSATRVAASNHTFAYVRRITGRFHSFIFRVLCRHPHLRIKVDDDRVRGGLALAHCNIAAFRDELDVVPLASAAASTNSF